MNRQLIIRGAAVSTVAIAASVFAAGQFLGDKQTLASGSITDAPGEIRGASLASPFNSPAAPEDAAPQDAAPELTFSALDPSEDAATVPDTQGSFQPELTFADTSRPHETSLCDASLTAAPAIDGLIEVRLSAPCNIGERVVISHGDLAFTAKLDKAGALATYIPALSETAMVEAFMSDDTMLQAQTQVADLDQYARMIVQWTGADAVSLHAYHRGAQHNEPGHIHAMNPFDPELEASYLVALGDETALEPMLAHVYSVPLLQADETFLQLELAVTEATCGRDMTAYVLPSLGSAAGQPQELTVAMPDCGSGDGLVIVDLPFDTEVAAPEALELSMDTPQDAMVPVLAIEGQSPES